ncbi:MAG: hypothetical protein Q9196_006771, partial [Gyalolechia fulgens]
MAILEDVEVRVVSKGTNQPLTEYQKSGSTARLDQSFVEKYIESKDGEDFQVKVWLKKGFSCWGRWGIVVGIKIDGGVVDYFNPRSRADVLRLRDSEQPIVLDFVPSVEGSEFCRIGFRFGSLGIDENVDLTREDLEAHAATLGVIEVYVERVSRKRRAQPKPRGLFYKPLATVDVAKELLKEKHVDSVMQPGKKRAGNDPGLAYYDYEAYRKKNSHRMSFKFRYRSEMNLRLLGLIARNPTTVQTDDTVPNIGNAIVARSATPLIVPKVESQATTDIQTNMVAENRGPAPRDYDSMAERVESLEQQLKESQERTEAMMRNLMGGLSTAI